MARTDMRSRCLVFWLSVPLIAQTNVLTYHNDRERTGQNLTETVLTSSNVNSSAFGKLFLTTLDGRVDAQPLYVANVSIPNQGTHNVLIAATENDSVYALDADAGGTLWEVSLLAAGETPSDDRGCQQVTPQIGATATPVINPTGTSRGIIYIVAMSKDSLGNYHQRLHALARTTGAELSGGPVEIQAKFPGSGPNSSGGYVTFDTLESQKVTRSTSKKRPSRRRRCPMRSRWSCFHLALSEY